MPGKESPACGKDLRKFLYVIGFVSIFVLIGSYWYMEYYLKGRGFGAESAHSGASVSNSVTPVAQMLPAAAPFEPINVAARGPFTTVAGALKRSVVNISATSSKASPSIGPGLPNKNAGNGVQFAEPFAGKGVESIGSGVIITPDGYIVTNYHVVDKAKTVHVAVFGPQGSKRYHAEVVQLGELVDLALLKIDPDSPLIPAAIGDSDNLTVGEQVIAIGSPFGLDQTVSQGIVSSMRKSMIIEGITHRNLIQTDAAINQGNSGGPLVDTRGYIIGINTAIYTPTGAFAGIGFAVPANTVRLFVEEMVTLPRIKPQLKPAFMQKGGFVNAATKIAPTIQAGAKMPHSYMGPCGSCHTIIPSNLPPDRQMAGGSQFAVGPGGAVGMNAAITTVAMTQQAKGVAGLWLGAEVQPVDRVVARYFESPTTYGLFINSVYQGSPAETAGLMSGDIIFKMNGRRMYAAKELVERVAAYSKGDEVRLSIVRNGKKQDLYLDVGAMPGNLTPALMPNPGKAPKAGQPVMLNQAIPPSPMMVPKEFEWLGMEFDPIKAGIVRDHPALKGKKGALVVEVTPGSQGAMAGVRTGDIILSINQSPVGSPEALNNAINTARASDGILLTLERNSNLMYAVIQ